MVMHARKQPRLSDGYTDKRDSHLYQSSQYPSKSKGEGYRQTDRYKRESSYDRARDSPSRDSPRYHNKNSYIERTKERLEKGSSNVNHTSRSNDRSQNGGHFKTNSQDNRDKKTELTKTALRVCGVWSEHISTSKHTMGKKYYYNSKTEESTWTKPKEWVDEPANRPRTSTSNDKSYTSSKSADVFNSSHNDNRTSDKNSLKNSDFDAGSGKPDKQFLIKKFQESQIDYRTSQPSSSSHRSDHSKLDHRRDSYDHNRRRRDSEGNRSYGHRTPKKHEHHEDMDISPSSTPTSSRQSSCAGTPQLGPVSTPASVTTPGSLNLSSRIPSTSTTGPLISALPHLITQLSGVQNNQDLTNKALQTLHQLQEVIKRQIAQQQTPDFASGPDGHTPVTSQQQPHPASRSAPIQITSSHQHSMNRTHPQQTISNPHLQMTSHMPVQNQGSIYGRVMSQQPTPPMNGRMHVQQHSPNMRMVTHPSPHLDMLQEISMDGNHMTSHHYSVKGEVRQGGESPASDTSRTSCMSPNSTTSSQNACVEAGPLTNMGVTKDPAADMMNSLKQYYNENLVSHVSGWQAEHAERQANRYWEEGLKIGSFHCSQVSVNLKRARSLVRLAEIQSTLHEQRILFLNQQVHQLEGMKPPSFSSSQPFTSSSQ
ncbi:WW domain-containing adapter protein with coiled-coil homolog isoform X1 [Mytilus trossulus]|uniref:WW domain-containing adapter protein with coiled-coil homolog isoform X1 n=1 Tax=Mytilus trossulus TaxID=6551 RepID=UPI003006B5BE